jgi:hypothetical protein
MKRSKRFFNWCPEPQTSSQQMLRQYSKPILALLIVSIITASAIAAASLAFSQSIAATPLVIDQTIRNATNPTLTPTQTEKPAVTPTPTINNARDSSNPNEWPNPGEIAKAASPTPTPLLTQDQAIEIAMPLINQYATNHNRTITTIKATFSANSRTYTMPYPPGTNLTTLPTPLATPIISDPFPGWLIDAAYVRTGQDTGAEYWIVGYQVVVRADNGQVASSNVAGII